MTATSLVLLTRQWRWGLVGFGVLAFLLGSLVTIVSLISTGGLPIHGVIVLGVGFIISMFSGLSYLPKNPVWIEKLKLGFGQRFSHIVVEETQRSTVPLPIFDNSNMGLSSSARSLDEEMLFNEPDVTTTAGDTSVHLQFLSAATSKESVALSERTTSPKMPKWSEISQNINEPHQSLMQQSWQRFRNSIRSGMRRFDKDTASATNLLNATSELSIEPGDLLKSHSLEQLASLSNKYQDYDRYQLNPNEVIAYTLTDPAAGDYADLVAARKQLDETLENSATFSLGYYFERLTKTVEDFFNMSGDVSVDSGHVIDMNAAGDRPVSPLLDALHPGEIRSIEITDPGESTPKATSSSETLCDETIDSPILANKSSSTQLYITAAEYNSPDGNYCDIAELSKPHNDVKDMSVYGTPQAFPQTEDGIRGDMISVMPTCSSISLSSESSTDSSTDSWNKSMEPSISLSESDLTK